MSLAPTPKPETPFRDTSAAPDQRQRDPSTPADDSFSTAQLRQRVELLQSLDAESLQKISLKSWTWHAHIEEARCLLAAGADPGAVTTRNQSSLLMLASDSGRVDMIKLLLPLVSPNALNAQSQNALFSAVRGHNSGPCVRALISVVNPDQVDSDGQTPLMVAIIEGSDRGVTEALASVCDMDRKTPLGETCEQLEQERHGEHVRVVRDAFAHRKALIERDELLISASEASPGASSRRM